MFASLLGSDLVSGVPWTFNIGGVGPGLAWSCCVSQPPDIRTHTGDDLGIKMHLAQCQGFQFMVT